MAIEEEPNGEARPLKIDYILADLTFQYNNDWNCEGVGEVLTNKFSCLQQRIVIFHTNTDAKVICRRFANNLVAVNSN